MNTQECGEVVYQRLVKAMDTINGKDLKPEVKTAQIDGIIRKQFGSGFTINEVMDAVAKEEYWKLELQTRRATHTNATRAKERIQRLAYAYVNACEQATAE